MCVTGNKTIDTTLVIAATIAATVVAGPEAGYLVYAGIGAASGAAMAGAQGRDPLTGAIVGGITGGITGGLAPPGVGEAGRIAADEAAKGLTTSLGQTLSSFGGQAFTGAAAQHLGQVALGTAAAGALGAMMPGAVSVSGYTPISVSQRYNENIATTGSGGRQAAGSLASAIKRSKKRKLTQSDVGDLSIDTGSFANTGLQLA